MDSLHLFIHQLFVFFFLVLPVCLEYLVLGVHIYLYSESLIFGFQDKNQSGFKFCVLFQLNRVLYWPIIKWLFSQQQPSHVVSLNLAVGLDALTLS